MKRGEENENKYRRMENDAEEENDRIETVRLQNSTWGPDWHHSYLDWGWP